MKGYFDTSCLVALYVPNDHTAAALRHRARAGRQPILFTPLHRLELRTTVRQCAYGGLIRQADARQILRHIEEDLDDGTLIHEPLDWTESLRQAEAVAERLAWTKAPLGIAIVVHASLIKEAVETYPSDGPYSGRSPISAKRTASGVHWAGNRPRNTADLELA